MKKLRLSPLFFSLLFLQAFSLTAQKPPTRMLNQIIEGMILGDSLTTLMLQGYEIIDYDHTNRDSDYNLSQERFIEKRFDRSALNYTSDGKIIIETSLMVLGNEFKGTLKFKNMVFNGEIILANNSMTGGLEFDHCEFNNHFYLKVDTASHLDDTGYFLMVPNNTSLEISSSRFAFPCQLYIKGDYDLNIRESEFHGFTLYLSGNSDISFTKDSFFAIDDQTDRYDSEEWDEEIIENGEQTDEMDSVSRYGNPVQAFSANFFVGQVDGNADLKVESSVFYNDSQKMTGSRIMGEFSSINFNNNTINSALIFNESIIRNKLIMLDNRVNSHVSFSGMIFPELYIDVPWSQIDGEKIAFYQPVGSAINEYQKFYPYTGHTESELNDKHAYYQLIRAYSNLLNAYKDNGELSYYNACYSEMKDIQGRMYRNDYLESGRFKDYFKWILNRLLKVYTNHGTDPGLALLVTFYVVVVFGVIFFIFPSEWDRKSKTLRIQEFKDLVKSKNKGFIIPVIMLLAGILYSMINALTLSLNAFVTLGFGNIPTRGVARYMCIIEGFIGWFLLSIFTVALINQVLF